MRFYKEAHDYLLKASRREAHLQLLYLVPELDNRHDISAIMLHNGKQKLGNVTALAAPQLKKLFDKWAADGFTDVVVCSVNRQYQTLDNFRYVSSIQVYGNHRVNEDIAFTFASEHRKD